MTTGLDKQLLLDFFLTFSRFEYALKHSGLYQKQPAATVPYEARPDWDSFAVELRASSNPDKTAELREAVDHILVHPPFRGVVGAGGSRMGYNWSGGHTF